MTGKDLSIFNSLRPFSIGFDDMFDQFENMLGNGSLSMQSNYPPYNIRKTGKDDYSIEVALAGFNKNDVEVEFEDNLLTVKTKQVNKCRQGSNYTQIYNFKYFIKVRQILSSSSNFYVYICYFDYFINISKRWTSWGNCLQNF